MAQASTITMAVRQRTTKLLDELAEVGPIMDLIEDPGASDAARQAFFETYLKDAQGGATTDINWQEFTAAIVALRALRTWLTANRPAMAKLRI